MDENQKQLIQILANCQGLFFDQNIKKYLYKKYKIVSKNIGVDKSTKSMKDFMIEPYLLDKFSVSFLLEKQPASFNNSELPQCCKQTLSKINNSFEIKVFKQLKQKYFLIQGHKFGSSFLAYDQNPQKNHAKSLIFCGTKNEKYQNFNHMTRLAEIAKKQCLYAYYDDLTQQIITQKLQRQKIQNSKRNNKKNKIQTKKNEQDLYKNQ